MQALSLGTKGIFSFVFPNDVVCENLNGHASFCSDLSLWFLSFRNASAPGSWKSIILGDGVKKTFPSSLQINWSL